jgi:hypothetical protein
MKQILLLILLSSVFFSCRKDVDPCDFDPNSYNYLSNDNKAKIPYNGDELLMFTNNFGDTAICIGKGREQFFTTDNWYDYGCERQMFSHYEAYKIKFLDENKKLNIEIVGYFKDEFGKGRVYVSLNGHQKLTVRVLFASLTPKYEITNFNSSKNSYQTVPIYSGSSNLDTVYYSLKRGIIGIKKDTLIWRLYE